MISPRRDPVFVGHPHVEEVQTLKDLTCDAPVVAYPQFGTGATFVLETDASV